MFNLARPGKGTGDSAVIRLFTDITQDFVGTIRRKMTELFAVVTDYRVTCINVVAGLIAVATCAWLAFISEVNEDFAKSDVIRDSFLNPDSVVTHAVLNMVPPFLSKITAAMMNDITKFREALNNCCIGHLVRGVKNLHVRERTVNILKRKWLVAYLHHIMRQKLVLRTGIAES